MLDSCKFCGGELEGTFAEPDMETQDGAYTQIFECTKCGAKFGVYMKPVSVRIIDSSVEQRIETALPTDAVMALLKRYELYTRAKVEPSATSSVLRHYIMSSLQSIHEESDVLQHALIKDLRNKLDIMDTLEPSSDDYYRLDAAVKRYKEVIAHDITKIQDVEDDE